MPGIPKSQRCQRCKQRKIKCDEKWPVCTPCARTESACSGPPTMVKFVHNGRHSSTTVKTVAVTESSDNTKGEVVQTRQRGTFVNLGSRNMPEGSTYQSMRLVERLRPGPTTTADRLAARLVGYFDRSPSRDPSVVLAYFRLLPQRLGQSAALRDSIALFCSCWSSFQRGVPDGHFMDYNLYGKALRSLQRALNDPTEQLSCETLAATTILDRTEIFFDAKRLHGKAVHVAGIVALLIKRGPPKLNDDLDIHLALENQGRLISTWVVEGGRNPYASSAWRERLKQAVRKEIDPPSRLAEAYQLEPYVSCWPPLIQDMRLLRGDPSKASREDRALNIHERATRFAAELKLLGEELIEKARQSKQMIEVADPDAIPGVKYEFNSPEPLQVLMVYVTLSIILNRILFNLAPYLGFSDSLLDIEHKRLCRQILLSLSHIEGRGPICAYSYLSQVMLAVEGVDGADRTHMLEFIRKTDIHKGRLPQDPSELEKFAIENSRGIAGQGTFVRFAIT